MQRPQFRVSCKAAIYDTDRRFVLVARYTPMKSGIPGGHLEYDESPDDAMVRELREEIGAVPRLLTRTDFFVTSEGKVVLGYVGELPYDQDFSIDPVEITLLEGVAIDDIRTGKHSAGSYDEFILKWA